MVEEREMELRQRQVLREEKKKVRKLEWRIENIENDMQILAHINKQGN